MGILCTICMRGGSKGVRNKNIRLLNNHPLLSYTIQQAMDSKLFEHIVISTDSELVAEKARSVGAEAWFIRPAEMATDYAPKVPVIRHALIESEKRYGCLFDVIIDLDVTSPLRLVSDIIDAYKMFTADSAEILFTGCPSRRNPYFNMVEIIDGRVRRVKGNDESVVRRQDAPKVFDINASIYIWRRETLLRLDTLYTENTSLYVMPEERSIDIDSELDWTIVEFLLSRRREN